MVSFFKEKIVPRGILLKCIIFMDFFLGIEWLGQPVGSQHDQYNPRELVLIKI